MREGSSRVSERDLTYVTQPLSRAGTDGAMVGVIVEEMLPIGLRSDRPSLMVATMPESDPDRLSPMFSLTRSRHARRLLRYGATSVLALGISEAVLLAVYTTGAIDAALAALIGNAAGTVPSYLVSRYWIWSDAPRERTARQVTFYWGISLISMVLSSIGTGAIAHLLPKGTSLHLLFVGGGFFVMSFVLWIAKFALYQGFVFPTGPPRTA